MSRWEQQEMRDNSSGSHSEWKNWQDHASRPFSVKRTGGKRVIFRFYWNASSRSSSIGKWSWCIPKWVMSKCILQDSREKRCAVSVREQEREAMYTDHHYHYYYYYSGPDTSKRAREHSVHGWNTWCHGAMDRSESMKEGATSHFWYWLSIQRTLG